MQYLLLHGSFGHSEENWFPWLKENLEERGTVIVPSFPIESMDEINELGKSKFVPHKQTLTSWMDHFEEHVLPEINPNDGLIIAAHSLGPLFCLHLVERFNLKVKLAVFVSPSNEELDLPWEFERVNYSFIEKRFDYRGLKSSIGKMFVIYSDDDPYVPEEASLKFAKKLDAATIKYEGAGHFNEASGYTTFPLVLALMNTIKSSRLH